MLGDNSRALDLEADPRVSAENVDFAAGRGGVDVQGAIAIAVVDGDEVELAAIDHGEAANRRGRKDVVNNRAVGGLFVFSAQRLWMYLGQTSAGVAGFDWRESDRGKRPQDS